MKHDHLDFSVRLELSPELASLLRECAVLIRILKEVPLTPEARKDLMRVSFKKGALSTTAIEGNSVTDEEYDDIVHNTKPLAPSRRYQQVEVENMVGAFNYLISNVTSEHMREMITPDLIRSFHKLVIQNLGDAAPAVPGQFRNNNVTVGRYRPPDYAQVPKLIEKYCDWLRNFGYSENQNLEMVLVEAIAAHVYLEWIHPFGDGNGRTGRLIEYYVLIRGGLPLIAGHILSNFYNNTRDKYYRMFEACRSSNDLAPFLMYAAEGFRDGLNETYASVRESQILVFWQRVIYDTFDHLPHTKKEAHKRKRKVLLNFPLNEGLKLPDIPMKTGVLEYARLTANALYRDIKEMEKAGLLVRKDDQKLYANWEQVCQEYFDPA
jgi:Fic family protein